MFSAEAYVGDVKDIPAHWIFETYLGIPSLSGNTVRVKSMFNPNDKTPSMYIFYSRQENTYLWKCFSTGRSGAAVNLMQELWNLSFNLTAEKIRSDYQKYLADGTRPQPIQIEAPVNWKVSTYKTRGWVKDDADFWIPFNIGSKLLERYNVRPLDHYFMRKDQNDLRSEAFRVSGNRLYGYFTKEGTLYKVYQPERKPKALKVENYIQGLDQLEGHRTLILTSSLKDIMAIKSMPLIKSDVLANDSESVYFTREQLQSFYDKYDLICTYMDSDEAGIKSMKYYRDLYGIPLIYIPLEKDPSDLNKFRGVQRAQEELIPRLITAAEFYRDLRENIYKKLYNL